MDLKYELSQDREVVAVVIGNRLNMSQQCAAVDHINPIQRAGAGSWNRGRKQGGGGLISFECSLHHSEDDQVRITMMMWTIMIVPSFSHHDIRKICKNYCGFQKERGIYML